jgi:glutathione S-transferase
MVWIMALILAPPLEATKGCSTYARAARKHGVWSLFMILIGQFDSPYTRRVGVALELYGLTYEHRPWSTFGDADKIAHYNPLLRVPTLVLDDGEALVETLAILDAVDEMAPPGRRLIASTGPDRRRALNICAFAGGISDKVVQFYYSTKFSSGADAAFLKRIESQIKATLDKLERDLSSPKRSWCVGERMSHADIALAATLRHFRESVGKDWGFSRWPALIEHAAQCEALEVFKKISQPFVFVEPKS